MDIFSLRKGGGACRMVWNEKPSPLGRVPPKGAGEGSTGCVLQAPCGEFVMP